VVAESWPVGNAKLAEDNKVTYAIQIGGKVRATMDMP